MKYEHLVELGNKMPVIETKMLLKGGRGGRYAKVQISRLVRSGKLVQIRRGLYLLPPAYRKIRIFEPFLANMIKRPSYLSLEKSLEYHGVIPEAVPVFTSVTTKRPASFKTRIGRFSYNHVKTSLFWGYAPVTIDRQTALIALPEKAVLDLFYLRNERVTRGYIKEMRLQNLNKFNVNRLKAFAAVFGKRRVIAAAALLAKYIRTAKKGEKKL